MSDSVREAFEAHYFSCHGGGNMTFDHANSYYLDSDVNDYWLAFQAGEQAALSANGGEAGEIIHVGFTNPAQIGYAKDESGFFYPDTDNQCYIPLYMLKRHLNRMGHDYTHPAPPSVAVPEHAVLARAWYHADEDGDYNIYDALNTECPDCIEVIIVRADNTSGPDHIADAGKVAFVDGVGAQRMTAEECKEGIEYIIHGDNIYWPLSDDDELRLIQAACGNGEFTYPVATPSVPENEIKARALEDAALKVVAEAVEIEVRLDDGQDIVEGTAGIEEHIAEWLHKEAARLRTAGNEREEGTHG